MTKIQIYNINQFTKSGHLKKNAKPEYTSEWPETSNAFKEANSIKASGYHDFKTPYVFTHINAINKDGQDVKIFQDVYMNGAKFMTSPTELIINLT